MEMGYSAFRQILHKMLSLKLVLPIHGWGQNWLLSATENHQTSLGLHCDWQICVFPQCSAGPVLLKTWQQEASEQTRSWLLSSWLFQIIPWSDTCFVSSFGILYHMFFSPLILSFTNVSSALLPRDSMSKTRLWTVVDIIGLETKLTNHLSFISIFWRTEGVCAAQHILQLFHRFLLLCSSGCWLLVMLLLFFCQLCWVDVQFHQPVLQVLGCSGSISADLEDLWLSKKWHLLLHESCSNVLERDQVQWMWKEQGWLWRPTTTLETYYNGGWLCSRWCMCAVSGVVLGAVHRRLRSIGQIELGLWSGELQMLCCGACHSGFVQHWQCCIDRIQPKLHPDHSLQGLVRDIV